MDEYCIPTAEDEEAAKEEAAKEEAAEEMATKGELAEKQEAPNPVDATSATSCEQGASAESDDPLNASRQEDESFVLDPRKCSSCCRRFKAKGCTNDLCYNCCSKLTELECCDMHRAKLFKMQEEERFIQELIANGSKGIEFRHFEDRLNRSGQTVLLWSLADFLRNRKFNESVFAKIEKAARMKQSLARRSQMKSLSQECLAKEVRKKARGSGEKDRIDGNVASLTSSTASQNTCALSETGNPAETISSDSVLVGLTMSNGKRKLEHISDGNGDEGEPEKASSSMSIDTVDVLAKCEVSDKVSDSASDSAATSGESPSDATSTTQASRRGAPSIPRKFQMKYDRLVRKWNMSEHATASIITHYAAEF
jgi:hypothetical protein